MTSNFVKIARVDSLRSGALNRLSLSSTEEDAMGEVVNLNRFRKARLKAEQEQQAEEKRVRHGRSKSDKILVGIELDRTDRDLDGKKLT
jgi:hypothetical protein